jgi:hypothetical protein
MNAEQPSGTLPPSAQLLVVIVHGALLPTTSRFGAWRALTNGCASRERISTHSLNEGLGRARGKGTIAVHWRLAVNAGAERHGASRLRCMAADRRRRATGRAKIACTRQSGRSGSPIWTVSPSTMRRTREMESAACTAISVAIALMAMMMWMGKRMPALTRRRDPDARLSTEHWQSVYRQKAYQYARAARRYLRLSDRPTANPIEIVFCRMETQRAIPGCASVRTL